MPLPQPSLALPSLTSKPPPPYLNYSIIHSTINNLDLKMFGKHLRRAHLVQALKKKWFLPKKRRIKEWEVTKKFNWVELAERELKIERVIGIKRFVRSNEGRGVGIAESIK
ncbi:hypothetical protein GOBAR_DD11021 [Gossypium barbadense]|nr:hypothetical protein GOBAR_DD11021 [Gossypium barbadense]